MTEHFFDSRIRSLPDFALLGGCTLDILVCDDSVAIMKIMKVGSALRIIQLPFRLRYRQLLICNHWSL